MKWSSNFEAFGEKREWFKSEKEEEEGSLLPLYWVEQYEDGTMYKEKTAISREDYREVVSLGRARLRRWKKIRNEVENMEDFTEDGWCVLKGTMEAFLDLEMERSERRRNKRDCAELYREWGLKDGWGVMGVRGF